MIIIKQEKTLWKLKKKRVRSGIIYDKIQAKKSFTCDFTETFFFPGKKTK